MSHRKGDVIAFFNVRIRSLFPAQTRGTRPLRSDFPKIERARHARRRSDRRLCRPARAFQSGGRKPSARDAIEANVPAVGERANIPHTDQLIFC